MKKLKIYLDTSVISHLDQQDNPEYMQITKELWEELKQGKYDVYLSSVVITELSKCKEPKRSRLLEYMSQIEFKRVEINEQVLELARRYVSENIIPSKFFDDALHIAAAKR
ncbi:PIN domain-containing protein [Caldicellulosiruptor danielii]|uniref:PIN domain-containing protein n=1 Tax=Anaerocellum danielii TaxID=1387557 RepID=A0ABZ0U349_9FIRM|nr:PIN domain-containing protein [Caldicellulosiruptor danielii]WPX09512.1 PIN domain-containing protein [Caldicellulosiruptor danielii]